MARREIHGDFDRWSEAGTNHGYLGPTQLPGHKQYRFVDPDGNTVGHWSGQDGQGHLHVPDAPPPAQEPENGQPEGNEQV